jgi:ribosome biogenesis GTPase
VGEESGKYKGTKGPHARSGLGRLRRASEKSAGRVGGIENRVDDDDFLERLRPNEKATHSGENLLAKFNRLAADSAEADAVEIRDGEVCGFAGTRAEIRDTSAAAGEEPRQVSCEMRNALKKRIAGVRNPLAVGDRVRWRDDGNEAGLIVAVRPRTNQLARPDSHNRALWHVLAANVDAVVIVGSVAEPNYKPAFIDRYLVLASACGVASRVVINKADLGDAGPAVALYRSLGLPTYATVANAAGDAETERLRGDLAGLVVVFAGQSGVGKSSLVNVIYPGLGAKVSHVAVGGLGRHTTTAARSYVVPGGGRVIDTPGIRECGIAGLEALDVALLYPDIARFQPDCRFTDCTHLHEPGCAVEAAVQRGEIADSRYDSYRAIVIEDLALGS